MVDPLENYKPTRHGPSGCDAVRRGTRVMYRWQASQSMSMSRRGRGRPNSYEFCDPTSQPLPRRAGVGDGERPFVEGPPDDGSDEIRLLGVLGSQRADVL